MEEVEIDQQEFSPKLVLYGAITEDSLISVKVSESKYITDTSSCFLPDATVKLYEENNYLEDLQYDSAGIFKSNVVAKQGTKYTIEVQYPDLETIRAETQIPPKPVINEISFQYSYGTMSYGEPASKLVVSVQDIPNQENYYLLSFKERNNNFVFSEPLNPINLSEKKMILYYVFSDKLFENSTADLSFAIQQSFEDTIIYNVVLQTVTKDYYLYNNSLLDYGISSQDNYFDFNTEYPQLYSNVENGYGIFYGYNQTEDSLTYIVEK